MTPRNNSNNTHLIVIGSGVAGLSAALAAARIGATVDVLTAGDPMAGSSPRAQGGVAAVVDGEDSLDLHEADTFAVGAGLNDAAAVHALVEDGRRAALRLLADGVPFDGGPLHPELGLEAGHSRRRILHAGGGATGWALTAALLEQAAAHPNITIHAHTGADALITGRGERGAGSGKAEPDIGDLVAIVESRASGRDHGMAEGVTPLPVLGVRSGMRTFYGPVVLATGGYAALWDRTTNAPETVGVGLRLAWEAGASLADLEFVQFHPTALDLPGRPAFLLTEALRGEGARVVNAEEQEIVNPLLARDVVARAIHRYRQEHGPVYLSLRHLDPDFVRARFPNLAVQLDSWGLDIARDLLPIAPAAHYCMGGVRTDVDGRTDVPGLYAAGEVACTGVQGANRLASNSLLECLVFGERAGLAALHDAPGTAAGWELHDLPEGSGRSLPATPAPAVKAERLRAAGSVAVLERTAADISVLLDRDLAVAREAGGLARVLAQTEPASLPSLIARAALLREESRGAHFRADFPETSRRWQGRIHWRQGHAPRFEKVGGQ